MAFISIDENECIRVFAKTSIGATTDWARICNKEGNLRTEGRERNDTLKWE